MIRKEGASSMPLTTQTKKLRLLHPTRAELLSPPPRFEGWIAVAQHREPVTAQDIRVEMKDRSPLPSRQTDLKPTKNRTGMTPELDTLISTAEGIVASRTISFKVPLLPIAHHSLNTKEEPSREYTAFLTWKGSEPRVKNTLTEVLLPAQLLPRITDREVTTPVTGFRELVIRGQEILTVGLPQDPRTILLLTAEEIPETEGTVLLAEAVTDTPEEVDTALLAAEAVMDLLEEADTAPQVEEAVMDLPEEDKDLPEEEVVPQTVLRQEAETLLGITDSYPPSRTKSRRNSYPAGMDSMIRPYSTSSRFRRQPP